MARSPGPASWTARGAVHRPREGALRTRVAASGGLAPSRALASPPPPLSGLAPALSAVAPPPGSRAPCVFTYMYMYMYMYMHMYIQVLPYYTGTISPVSEFSVVERALRPRAARQSAGPFLSQESYFTWGCGTIDRKEA